MSAAKHDSNPKHTPGPWTLSDLAFGPIAVCAGIRSLATVRCDEHVPNGVENARLIAAAPVLFSALERIYRGASSQSAHAGMSWQEVADVASMAISQAILRENPIPTPRTDAAKKSLEDLGMRADEELIALARELERELAQCEAAWRAERQKVRDLRDK